MAFVTGESHGHPLAARALREEVLVLALPVVADQCVGGAQDRRGRAEILAQGDDPGALEALLEIEDVGDVCAAPPVDRLVRIAHDKDVRLGAALFGRAR